MHKGIGVVAAVLLMFAVAGCGSGVATVKSSSTHRCPSGTVSVHENGQVHCLATAVSSSSAAPSSTPSASSHTVSSASPTPIVGGFRWEGHGAPPAGVVARTKLLDRETWNLTIPNYHGLIQASVIGWRRMNNPFSPVEKWSGAWGTLWFDGTTVQVGTTVALQRDDIWTYRMTPGSVPASVSSQTLAQAAQILAVQLQSVATTLWANGHQTFGVTQAQNRPAVTIRVTNGVSGLCVTLANGGTTWQVNGSTFWVNPDQASPILMRWLSGR